MPRTALEAGFGDSKVAALPGSPSYRQSVNTSAGMFGGTQAAQMKQASTALESASNDLQKVYQTNAALEATDLSTQMQREANDLQYDPNTGFYAAKGGAALDLKKTAQQKMDDLGKKYGEKASNPAAAALFSKSFEGYRNSVMEGVMRHELAQTNTYRKDTVEGRKSINAEKAGLQWNDDKAFGVFLKDNTSAVLADASAEGWPPAKLADELWKSNSKLYHSRAYTMLNSTDPNVVIEGGKFYQQAVERGDLTMDDIKSLDSMRDTALPAAISKREVASLAAPAVGFGTLTPDEIFDKGIIGQESGGRRYKADGVTLLEGPMTKYGTAKGEAQVLDSTNLDPGYGVRPADMSGTPEQQADERRRVGKDYFKAMGALFGDARLGALAYNWGPDNLQKHITKVGDPLKGQISMERFIASVPSKEAREYVPGVMKKLGLGTGDGMIDMRAAQERAQEAEALYPGAGERVLSDAAKHNKVIGDAQKQDQETLSEQAIVFMQQNDATAYDLPTELQAKLKAAGVWETVSKYDRQSDRNLVDEITLMDDQQLAGVNLRAPELRTRLSSADYQKVAERQRKVKEGDADFTAFRTQVGQYWMEKTGNDKASSDKALYFRRAEEWFDENRKKTGAPPTREQQRAQLQLLSIDDSYKRARADNSVIDVGSVNYEKNEAPRYASLLDSRGFDVTDDNMELMRNNPQAIIGQVAGVPKEKVFPIVGIMVANGWTPDKITPDNIKRYYDAKGKTVPNDAPPPLERSPYGNARGRAWAKSFGLSSEPFTEEEKKHQIKNVPSLPTIPTRAQLKEKGKQLDKSLGF